MSTTAFPVRQTTDGVGCTDVMLRRIFGALYPAKGIITGLAVSGQNALSYKVAEGVAVCSKGESDGSTLAYFEGGKVEITANTATNPRIDVVYITSHDVTQGDTDNLVTLGVVQGTAAATPTEPNIPSYATKLCAMQLPANASSTINSVKYGSLPYAVGYGGSQGVLAEIVNTASTTSWGSRNGYTGLGSTTFNVTSKRTVQFNVTVTGGANSGEFDNGAAAVDSRLTLDGSIIDNRQVRVYKAGGAVSQFYQYTTTVEAGTHSLVWAYKLEGASSIRLYYNKPNLPGQVVQVVDLGAAD